MTPRDSHLERVANAAARSRAFTLVELLVSIAIIATLLAVLLPALGRTIGTARGFRCQMSLRSVAFDFSVFADDQLHGDRGNDPREVGKNRFRVETFQASQYGVNEFWRWGTAATHTLPDASKSDPMRCSEVKGFITLSRNQPCSTAITPSSNVSFGFNMRLHRAEVRGPDGVFRVSPVVLTSSILSAPALTPLVWDVDGAIAEQRGATPIFSAPAAGSQGLYAGDGYWFPGMRHNGAVNIGMIDGSVSSSTRPLAETGMNWSFLPNP